MDMLQERLHKSTQTSVSDIISEDCIDIFVFVKYISATGSFKMDNEVQQKMKHETKNMQGEKKLWIMQQRQRNMMREIIINPKVVPLRLKLQHIPACICVLGVMGNLLAG